MKDVIFLLVGMKNFCCHIDPVEITFEAGKMIVITGPNGIGKTAVIQSLPFTFYGECEKGKGDDVVNTKVGKDCHTWAEFMINSDHYRVDRYVKFKSIGNSVTITKNHAKKPYKKGQREVLSEIETLLVPKKLFTNTLLFSQKIKTFFTDLNDAEQKEIFRKILKLEEYLLYQKKAAEKIKEVKETFDNIKHELEVNRQLQIDVDEGIEEQIKNKELFYKNTKESIKALEEDLIYYDELVEKLSEQVKSENLEGLNKTRDELNKQSVLISRIIEQFDSELASACHVVESKRKQKRAEFESQALEIENQINSEKAGVETQIRKSYSEKISIIETNKNTDQDRLTEFNHLIAEKEKSIKICEVKITSNTEEYNSKSHELSKLNNSNEKGKSCPTCKQEICDTHGIQEMIELVTKRMSELLKDTGGLNEAKETDESVYYDFVERREHHEGLILKSTNEIIELKRLRDAEIEESLEVFNKRISKNRRESDGAKGKLEGLCTKEKKRLGEEMDKKYLIEVDNKNIVDQEKLDIGKKIVHVEGIIENLQKEEFRVKEIKTAITNSKEAKFNDTSMDKLKVKKKELIKSAKGITKKTAIYTKLMKILTFWKEGYSSSGIQSMLIDEAIPFMNHRASYYLDKLSKGRYSVSFDTMKATKSGEFRDKISVNVFDTITHANSRTQLSGGQERIVDISTILTLSDLQSNIQDVKFNILLFDEIFDALDDANIEYVSKLLREIVGDKCLFIISHRHIDQIDADEQLSFH